MILRDVIAIEVGEEDWQGDYEWSTWASNVPASVTPINSIEADNGAGLATRYLVVTTLDLHTAPASGVDLRIVYGTKELQLEAGIERHTVDSRFHHCEVIVKDFYS